jgi:hypothetical protein
MLWKRNSYGVVGNPGGKIPPGRFRRRWRGNIKMNLREMGYYKLWTGFRTCTSGWFL